MGVKVYDAIVVGLGPGGAVAATDLGRAGLSVLGLEWKALPRYKVCGGGLSARIDRLLEPDYHHIIEKTIHAVQFRFAGKDSFQIASAEPIAYMVMRDRFDAYLVHKAREAGIHIHEDERVDAVSEYSDWVEVRTGRGRYRAQVVVGADGASSTVARSLFPEGRGRSMSGLEGEAVVGQRPVPLDAGAIVVDIGIVPGGYAWVFPKEGRLSIGVAEFLSRGRSPKGIYDRFVKNEPAMDGCAVPAGLGHPLPLYDGVLSEGRRLSTGRVLLIGDAAHLVDPLFGEGIYYAVLSGRMAARSIIEWAHGTAADLRAYDERVARDIYPEFRVAARMAWTVYTFPQVSHRMIRRRPGIMQLYAGVLKGQETYRSFYAKAKEEAKSSFAYFLRDACLSAFSR